MTLIEKKKIENLNIFNFSHLVGARLVAQKTSQKLSHYFFTIQLQINNSK